MPDEKMLNEQELLRMVKQHKTLIPYKIMDLSQENSDFLLETARNPSQVDPVECSKCQKNIELRNGGVYISESFAEKFIAGFKTVDSLNKQFNMIRRIFKLNLPNTSINIKKIIALRIIGAKTFYGSCALEYMIEVSEIFVATWNKHDQRILGWIDEFFLSEPVCRLITNVSFFTFPLSTPVCATGCFVLQVFRNTQKYFRRLGKKSEAIKNGRSQSGGSKLTDVTDLVITLRKIIQRLFSNFINDMAPEKRHDFRRKLLDTLDIDKIGDYAAIDCIRDEFNQLLLKYEKIPNCDKLCQHDMAIKNSSTIQKINQKINQNLDGGVYTPEQICILDHMIGLKLTNVMTSDKKTITKFTQKMAGKTGYFGMIFRYFFSCIWRLGERISNYKHIINIANHPKFMVIYDQINNSFVDEFIKDLEGAKQSIIKNSKDIKATRRAFEKLKAPTKIVFYDPLD